MNFRHHTRTGGAVALLAVTALLISGCSRGDADEGVESATSPGITDDSVSIGISGPLSGPAAGVGSCSIAGLYAYLEAKNADGGFEFGDGLTRTVELSYLDDAYDPAKTVSNFNQLVGDGIFAYVGALGTPTNAAIVPIANSEEVPQVLLQTGASAFSSDQEANPWTFGLLPTYYDEAFTFGEFLVATGEQITVAILSQNDDYGQDYADGFTDAVEGSDVTILDATTYEPTDTTLDSQVTQLAATDADILISAVSVTPLQVGVLTKAQSLGWLPRIFLPSNSATPATVVEPGNGSAYPAIYTTAISKVPASPVFAEDEDVIAYNAAFDEYGTTITTTFTPQCAWGWVAGAVLDQAFQAMEEPNRDSFMAALKSIEDYQAPLLLDGVTINTTRGDKPAIDGLGLVKYNGTGYGPTGEY
ncbi:ABC transporter substrate-binding protein [Pseudolysinimonas sp.]|uniref:ABC transporter substrate-binding protein n=1 Tax=Pseudolysinimonas sp. TaxID=2680009 RepID=UPI0037847CA1